MRHLFIGYGSISRKHIVNLRFLDPSATIETYDPYVEDATYREGDLRDLCHTAVVYICSPTALHYDHLMAVSESNPIGVFVEKPIVGKNQSAEEFRYLARAVPFAVGYNYRYHPVFREIKAIATYVPKRVIYLHIYGSESIHLKYGVTPLETMLCHSIDLALWLYGEAKAHHTHDGGVVAMTAIRHRNNMTSFVHADMASSFRVATCTMLLKTKDTVVTVDDNDSIVVNGGMERRHWFIEPDENMHRLEMKAWLNYLKTGERGDLCSFGEAVRVQDIMRIP